jgi:type VI secretion system protein ImpC
VIAGLLLGATFSQQGDKMKPGSVLSIGDMPFYYYTDSDGDQTALPCTERMLSSKMADLVSKHRFMPMLSIKGQPEIRLGGLGSVAGGVLAGSWKPVTGSSDAAPAPEAEVPAEEKAEAVAETTEEAPSESAEAPAEAATEAPASDPELDKLLADLNPEPAAEEAKTEETAPAAEGEAEMDPELAKLLKELG